MTSIFSSMLPFKHDKPIESGTTHRYTYREHKVRLIARPGDSAPGSQPSTVYHVLDEPTDESGTAGSPPVRLSGTSFKIKKGPVGQGPLRVVPGHTASDIGEDSDRKVKIGAVFTTFDSEQVSGKPFGVPKQGSSVYWREDNDHPNSWRVEEFNGPCFQRKSLVTRKSRVGTRPDAGLPPPIAHAIRRLPCDDPSEYSLAMFESDSADNNLPTAFLVDPTSLPEKFNEEKTVILGYYELSGFASKLSEASPVYAP